MKVTYSNEWPGGRNGRRNWDEVRMTVDRLVIGGAAAHIEFDNEEDPSGGRDAAQRYAREKLNCYEHGWELQTRTRGKVLMLKKFPFVKQHPLPHLPRRF